MKNIYSQFNPPPKRKIGPFDDGMTKQSFKDECDINSIVKKALRNGLLPDGNVNPMYGDFSDVKDYQEGLNVVRRAEMQFKSLPAHIRSKFDNDPAKLLEFVADPKNTEEMIELGLAQRIVPEPIEPPKGSGTQPAPAPKPEGAGAGP